MRLSAYNFKFANAGALNGASVLQLTKDGISLKIKKSEIDYIQSDKVAPTKTYDLGFTGEIKAVLVTSDLSVFNKTLRGIYNNDVTPTVILSQTMQEVELVDLEFYTQKIGTDEKYTITNLQIEAKLDAKFKVANAWFVPLVFKVTATTQLTIITDN